MSDWDEWIAAEEQLIDLLADELDELDAELLKKLRELDHHRRHLAARFSEVADEFNRIPKLTAPKLRDRAKEVRKAQAAARDLVKLFESYGDILERDADRLSRLRKRFE